MAKITNEMQAPIESMGGMIHSATAQAVSCKMASFCKFHMQPTDGARALVNNIFDGRRCSSSETVKIIQAFAKVLSSYFSFGMLLICQVKVVAKYKI